MNKREWEPLNVFWQWTHWTVGIEWQWGNLAWVRLSFGPLQISRVCWREPLAPEPPVAGAEPEGPAPGDGQGQQT